MSFILAMCHSQGVLLLKWSHVILRGLNYRLRIYLKLFQIKVWFAKEVVFEEVDIDLDQGEVPKEEQREVLGSLIEPLIKEGMDDEPISHQQVVCNEEVEVQVEDKIDSNSACVIANMESFESKREGLFPHTSEDLAP